MRRILLLFGLLLLVALLSLASGGSRGFTVYIAKQPAICGGTYAVFVLEIFRDRSMKLRGEMVSRHDLDGRLQEAFQTRAVPLLFIRADTALPFQDVIEIVDAASRRVAHIAFITPSVEREIAERPLCGLTISFPPGKDRDAGR